MKKFWILVLLIIGAITCYAVGAWAGIGLFIAIGLILEIFFWGGLFRSGKRSKSDKKD